METTLLDFLKENSTMVFILGVVIATASMILHLRKRFRQEAERKRTQQAAAKAAREADRQRQIQRGREVKPVQESRQSVGAPRVPLREPYADTFDGAAAPRQIAKWEAEIHQIGRQMIGTLDSKMVALQTLTLDANRAANRLELLLEHMEELVRQVQTPAPTPVQKNQASEPVPEPIPKPVATQKSIPEPTPDPSQAETQKLKEVESVETVSDQVDEKPTPSLIPRDQVTEKLDPLSHFLDDLDSEFDEMEKEAEKAASSKPVLEPVLPGKILRPADPIPSSASVTPLAAPSAVQTPIPTKRPAATKVAGAKEAGPAQREIQQREVQLLPPSISIPSAAAFLPDHGPKRPSQGIHPQVVSNPLSLSSPKLPGS